MKDLKINFNYIYKNNLDGCLSTIEILILYIKIIEILYKKTHPIAGLYGPANDCTYN